ncbi:MULTISPECIES: cysteine peptidase family C39 domain-containing protein [unclassified Acinetobacter]|uniref:cysteine peptidase family C39 domain-containing protein n=1 Tax=unclassified Acinetobacter TaxID=196816 RepID=UPI0015D1463F|nr:MULTISPECIES: cysteine peptidase family C39 domain-containing protein [unclassified Acinetobacter]
MSMEIPDELANLEANGGIYAVWMLLQHLGIDADIQQLIEVCAYEAGHGTTTIGLAVGLKKFGFQVKFYTEHDPELQDSEKRSYAEADQLELSILPAIGYAQIQQAFEQNQFVIVYYDTLDGVGNHSLVYDIDETEISFFDSFDAMPADVFEQQRGAEGICRQVIIVDVNDYVAS